MNMPQKEERERDKGFKSVDLPGFVGFANLPNQIHRNAVKKGFEFTMMVAGETGLGKSTLVDSLFLTDIYKDREEIFASKMIARTTEIQKRSIDIEERGVKLRLHVVDTPGFGDAMCSTNCYHSIVQYIDEQFERYLNEESGLNRRNLRDTRVHCLFYFLTPHQRGLKPLDVAVLRALHTRVNIVPLIAKADTLTKKELTVLKSALRDDIAEKGIRVYEIPECSDDEDEDYKKQCAAIRAAMPFAVVGANTVSADSKGRRVRGRKYEFGFVEIDNPEHCDFLKLRTLLVTHMQDLQEMTHEVLYENFRAARLSMLTSVDTNANLNAGDNVHVFRKPSGELTAVTNFTLTSEGNASQHSLSGNVEVEKQLQEKEAELRRMRELLARLQQGGASNLITSASSVSTSNLTASRGAVPNTFAGSSATLNAAMRYSMRPVPSEDGTSVSSSSGCCTPTAGVASSTDLSQESIVNKHPPEPARPKPNGAFQTIRGANSYASFNVTHSYTALHAVALADAGLPARNGAPFNHNADFADVHRHTLEEGPSLLSRTASLMPVKKPPPVAPRSGILALRKMSADASATASVTVTKDFVL